MHYIIGTQIHFVNSRPQPGMTSQTRQANKPAEFDYGKIYTLYNISRRDDCFVYMFRDSHGGVVEKKFDGLGQADKWLASVKRETLPDYTGFYSRNNS